MECCGYTQMLFTSADYPQPVIILLFLNRLDRLNEI
jgi:hypothetical protein